MTPVTSCHVPSRSVTRCGGGIHQQRAAFSKHDAPQKWEASCFTRECRSPLGEKPTGFSGSNVVRALSQGNVRYQRAAIWCQRDSVPLSRFSPVLLALDGLGGARVYGGNGRPGRQLNLVADALPGTSSRPQCSRTRFPFIRGRCASSQACLSFPSRSLGEAKKKIHDPYPSSVGRSRLMAAGRRVDE